MLLTDLVQGVKIQLNNDEPAVILTAGFGFEIFNPILSKITTLIGFK